MAYKVDSSKIDYSGLRPHKRDYNFKMDCNCDYKQKAKLNLDGTPRKHSVYLKDWAI